MSLSVCPAAIVEAPVEIVWENLAHPWRYSSWADGQVERVEPDGPACVGQTVYLHSKALGRSWFIVFHVEKVDHVKHQLGLYAIMPLGIKMRPHIACTRISETSCRVQYG